MYVNKNKLYWALRDSIYYSAPEGHRQPTCTQQFSKSVFKLLWNLFFFRLFKNKNKTLAEDRLENTNGNYSKSLPNFFFFFWRKHEQVVSVCVRACECFSLYFCYRSFYY